MFAFDGTNDEETINVDETNVGDNKIKRYLCP